MRGVRCDGCFLSASAAEPVPHDHDQRSERGLTVGHLLVEPDVERVHRLEQLPRRRLGVGAGSGEGEGPTRVQGRLTASQSEQVPTAQTKR